MLRSLLGLILVLWYDLTTLPFKDFLRKYRLVEVPVDGYQDADDRKAGRGFFPTGPGVPVGTVFRMKFEHARDWYWQWYAIGRDGSINKIPAEAAALIRKHYAKIRFRNRLLTLGLLALPPLAAYWLTSLLVGR